MLKSSKDEDGAKGSRPGLFICLPTFLHDLLSLMFKVKDLWRYSGVFQA